MKCKHTNTDKPSTILSILKKRSVRTPGQCDHVKANGEFCGSPALRGRNYCYFHLTHIGRRLRAQRAQAKAGKPTPESNIVELQLPPLEDANSIQVALMQVIDALLHNRLDSKRAGLVLYALQTAAHNLSSGVDLQQNAEASVAGSYDDFEEDFQLGDTAPELKRDESAEAEEEEDDPLLSPAQAAEVERALERFKHTKEDGTTDDDSDLDEAGNNIYSCAPPRHLMCILTGPLSEKYAAALPAPRCERNAASQRLELLPAPVAEDEEQAA